MIAKTLNGYVMILLVKNSRENFSIAKIVSVKFPFFSTKNLCYTVKCLAHFDSILANSC